MGSVSSLLRPVARAVHGGTWPVADPIQVDVAPGPDSQEALYWASIMAHLQALSILFRRLEDHRQRLRCDRALDRATHAVRAIWQGQSSVRVLGPAQKASTTATMGLDIKNEQGVLGLEVGWWAMAASTAYAAAAVYALFGTPRDHLAALSSEVYRAVVDGIRCSLPEEVGEELLRVATGSRTGDPAERVKAWKASMAGEGERRVS